MSAAELQRLAFLAWEEQIASLKGLGSPSDHIHGSLDVLAHLGCKGKYTADIQTDLVSYLGEPSVSAPFVVNVPLKVQKPMQLPNVHCLPVQLALPHLEFADLYNNHRRAFHKMILGPGPARFWRGVEQRQDPRLRNDPMQLRPGWRERIVPVSLHETPYL
jgi:hypothetical protein